LLLDLTRGHRLFADLPDTQARLIIGAGFERINSLGHREFLTMCAGAITSKDAAADILDPMAKIACADGTPGPFELDRLRLYQSVHAIAEADFEATLRTAGAGN
jgi:hypothetical protein